MSLIRYKIIIEYDGSAFHGWQRQDNAFSVQEALESALSHLNNGNPVQIFGAGRTDTGVHAIGQVAHFNLSKKYSSKEVEGAINFHLDNSKVAIVSCEAIDSNFHARFDAKSRSYLYRIINRESKICLDANRVWWIRAPLDIDAMREAAKYLIGEHDFSSFRASGCQAKSPVKNIMEINISNDIEIYIKANSFLYHMVRNIVGSLVMVGRGDWKPSDIDIILRECDRTKAGPTAPAHGLYFFNVDY